MSVDLNTLFKQISTSEKGSSLVKKYLTMSLIEKHRTTKTRYGGTLADCVRSGSVNADSDVGLYATDADAYNVFQDLFNPIIRDIHHAAGDTLQFTQPDTDFGDLGNPGLGNIDLEGKYILSTRVRLARNLEGFGNHPVLTDETRMEIEALVQSALRHLPDDLAGTYTPLSELSKRAIQRLVDDHLLFKDGDRFLEPTGMYNDWPRGRGHFAARGAGLHVWVNEEDHIRVFCLEQGADLDHIYGTVVRALLELERYVTFAHDPRLGFITMCPTNIGTTIRASALVRLPRVSALPLFVDICSELRLQVRGVHGEHTKGADGVYDISNKRRFGLTEIQVLREMARGVRLLLLLERSIEGALTDGRP